MAIPFKRHCCVDRIIFNQYFKKNTFTFVHLAFALKHKISYKYFVLSEAFRQ